jgi:uncharacterized membrane protein YraQ (UPF0718 family)
LKKNGIAQIVGISAYFLFIIASVLFDFDHGKQIGMNFYNFSIQMLKLLPCAFILIGLFEVWVKRETVEAYLGQESGFRGYMWAVVLAGTIVGGLYVAFPLAHSLYSKGAKLSVIFTFIGASAICRVTMTIFEASFMGIKFTVIRLLVSLPLVVITSILLGDYLTRRNYRVLKRE